MVLSLESPLKALIKASEVRQELHQQASVQGSWKLNFFCCLPQCINAQQNVHDCNVMGIQPKPVQKCLPSLMAKITPIIWDLATGTEAEQAWRKLYSIAFLRWGEQNSSKTLPGGERLTGCLRGMEEASSGILQRS